MEAVASSFRDPAGYVFRQDGEYFRAIRPEYAEHYGHLLQSGLYQTLSRRKLLLAHTEVIPEPRSESGLFKVLKPRQLHFVSHPFEWCFSQLKDAALVTLEIQKTALEQGMSLKDASAYNIQFVDGRPTHIDTLSFEKAVPGRPWVAYGQFCSHFLAPLALMAYTDVRLHQLLRVYLDGIPLDLAAELLPWRSWFHPAMLLHIHLHAASQRRLRNQPISHAIRRRQLSRNALRGLITSLENAVRRLHWQPKREFWGNYYEETVLGGGYVESKQTVVREFLRLARPQRVWDLGANTGTFSRLASETVDSEVISFDLDPECVELNYREARQRGNGRVLPLVLDVTNPSPACGWNLAERHSLLDRRRPDLVMALALVHHLALGHNLPLPWIAGFLRQLAPYLLIEFVPKDDLNARKLLQAREEMFADYDQPHFEAAFETHFAIERSEPVAAAGRRLYLMRRLGSCA